MGHGAMGRLSGTMWPHKVSRILAVLEYSDKVMRIYECLIFRILFVK